MQIVDGAILCHARSGRMTIQVPEIVIGSVPSYVDLPDEWFVKLHTEAGLPSRQGFTFLSEAGWEANRHSIRQAFASAPEPRGTWEDFEAKVLEIFAGRKAAVKQEIKRLRKRITRLKEIQW